jgi:taurine transport system permease protein
MNVISMLWNELVAITIQFIASLPYFAAYIGIILATLAVWRVVKRSLTPKKDFGSLKTVTFGDESAVSSNFVASVVSVVLIFLIWGSFTGSRFVPSFLHMPGAFSGELTFTYTAENAEGVQDDAEVRVIVHKLGEEPTLPQIEIGEGWAKNDVLAVQTYRSKLLLWDKNDDFDRKAGAKIVSINGQAVTPGSSLEIANGRVAVTDKGTINVEPATGWQMEPIWLPAPESVFVFRLGQIWSEGYKNYSLGEHLGYSLFRVVVGFLFGALIGIPLGYAMGLNDWFRGWFDPIVEFMRPVPPLALIPLIIIWFGIGEVGKVILLTLAALWIMTIAARAGVSGVRISKVHAAYSLGASKWQIMRFVIIPNSLPEIFTGARVAMGVCWGTVVAAELVAAEKGIGMMIMTASKFQQTDIVILGIVIIGIIGFGIDMFVRWLERVLVPWKGRG